MIELAGSVFRVSFDKEGEGTLVLKIPFSHQRQALLVAMETMKPLSIAIDDLEGHEGPVELPVIEPRKPLASSEVPDPLQEMDTAHEMWVDWLISMEEDPDRKVALDKCKAKMRMKDFDNVPTAKREEIKATCEDYMRMGPT